MSRPRYCAIRAYFPGGLGTWDIPAGWLHFEAGPAEDVTLQWATYRDASDQTSLSRIWGGIHPPVDDIPGRHIGIEIGVDAFEYATLFFEGGPSETDVSVRPTQVFPNPVRGSQTLSLAFERGASGPLKMQLYDGRGRLLREQTRILQPGQAFVSFDPGARASGVYFLRVETGREVVSRKVAIVR